MVLSNQRGGRLGPGSYQLIRPMGTRSAAKVAPGAEPLRAAKSPGQREIQAQWLGVWVALERFPMPYR